MRGADGRQDIDSALARATRKEEDRVGVLFARHGRYHHVVQVNLLTVGLAGVQGALENATLGSIAHARRVAGLEVGGYGLNRTQCPKCQKQRQYSAS